LVLAAVAAYSGTFSAPFVFDDTRSILENPTLRHLSLAALSPPAGGMTVSGRPLLNFSLAVNYAISGTQVWSYHALNLLIHALAGLTLFGIVRRTLEKAGTGGPPVRDLPGMRTERTDGWALSATAGEVARPYLVAFVIALLWTLHPLQTESVTYVIQRAESLMGLFYLLTLYCFIRGTEANGRIWLWLSVLCCLLGMASKEVMVTAPVIVLLYDRTFVSGSFREAWRRRRGPYLALGATWILLGWLVAGTGGRGGTAGFGSGVSWWAYGFTQFRAVAHYLRLAFWPHPLAADYGRVLGGSPPEMAWDMVVVGVLFAATVLAVGHRPAEGPSSPPGRGVAQRSLTTGLRRGEGRAGARAFGFVGAWFFLILAPSSSVVPVATEIIAEHRMYLPLAAVLVVAVVLLDAWLTRIPWLVVCGAVALGLGLMTAHRNEAYRSNLALWSDTVAKMPDDAFAQNNLGKALFAAGRVDEAASHYSRALQLEPQDAEAHYNLANILVDRGRLPEAIAEYGQALRYEPNFYQANNNLGLALMRAGRAAEAIPQFEATLRFQPDSFQGHCNLADALAQVGQTAESVEQYELALRADPNVAVAHENLGMALAQLGRVPEAIQQFEIAVQLDPNDPDLHYNLGVTLRHTGHNDEAAAQFEAASRLSGKPVAVP
jgi:tetratricopeptide (TPR) repeat protein